MDCRCHGNSNFGCFAGSLQTRTERTGNGTDTARYGGFFPACRVQETYSAAIRGRQDVDIIPQVSGRITRLCVKEGERVRTGQVLAVIDQVPYQAALRTAPG